MMREEGDQLQKQLQNSVIKSKIYDDDQLCGKYKNLSYNQMIQTQDMNHPRKIINGKSELISL